MKDGIDGFVPRLGHENSAPLPETRGSKTARAAEDERIARLPTKLAAKERRRQKRREKAQRREEERRARQMANTVTGQTTMAVAGTTAVVRKQRRRPTGKLTTEEHRILRGISDRHAVSALANWWIGNGCWQRPKVRDRDKAATLLLRGHIADAEKTAFEPVLADLRRLIADFVRLDRIRAPTSAKTPDPSPAPSSAPNPSPCRPAIGGATAGTATGTQSGTTNDVLLRFLEQQSQMMQSQGQLLTHLVMTMGNVQSEPGGAAFTIPGRPVFFEQTAAGEPEPPPTTEFKDMSKGRQRAILNSMHRRYAGVINSDGTVDGEQYKEAWNISYEHFERQIEIPIRDIASADRCRPLDIIFDRGLQVRFCEITRQLWEH